MFVVKKKSLSLACFAKHTVEHNIKMVPLLLVMHSMAVSGVA